MTNHVRLPSTGPITHETSSGGWTTCGILYGTPIHDEVIRLSCTPTDDPLDCMACLVQAAKGYEDVFTFHLPAAMPVVTYTIVLEPKK